MTVTIKLFAILRDIAGVAEIRQECAAEITAQQLAAHLAERLPTMVPHLAKLAFAVNEEFVPPGTALQNNDVLALIPPVSGG